MLRQANALLVIIIGFLVAYWLRFGPVPLTEGYLLALVISLFLASILLPASGAFRIEFEWQILRRMRRLVVSWVFVLLIIVCIAALTKTTDYYSRIWFGLWALISTLGLIVVQLVSHWASLKNRQLKRKTRPIVLVGSGHIASQLDEKIQHSPESDMYVAQRFGKPWSDQSTLPTRDLLTYLDQSEISCVWIAVPWEERTILYETLEALRDTVIDVNVVPDFGEFSLLNQTIDNWSGTPVINLSDTPITRAESILKSAMDRILSLCILIVLSPLLLTIGVLIRFSDGGPVIFRQKRNGIGGDSIEIYKFRTMQAGSERGGFYQAKIDDERVTRVGRILRRSSLDELPQLLNVIEGSMSLVGPRPHPVELNMEYKSRIPRYMLRHKVKPGITGWAQVNGYRGETNTEEKMAQRVEYDLWYIQNWSLSLDLKILLMTPFVMLHGNAY